MDQLDEILEQETSYGTVQISEFRQKDGSIEPRLNVALNTQLSLSVNYFKKKW